VRNNSADTTLVDLTDNGSAARALNIAATAVQI
jgi:hypothetical protein